jgi:hypothetical protein
MNHIEQTDYLMENGATLDTIKELVNNHEFGHAVSAVEDGNVPEVVAMLREQRKEDFTAEDHAEEITERKTGKGKKLALLGLAALVAGCTGVAIKDAPEVPQYVQLDADVVKTLLGDNPETTVTQYITEGKMAEAYTALSILYSAANRNQELEQKLETQLDQSFLKAVGLTYQTKKIGKKEVTVPVLVKKTEADVVKTTMQYLGDSSSRIALTAGQVAEIKEAKSSAAAMELAQKYVKHNESRVAAFAEIDGDKTTVYMDLMGTDEKTGYAIIQLEKGKVVDIKTDKDETMPKELESLVGNLLEKDSVAYTRSGEMVTGFAGKAYLAKDNAALAELVKKEFGINVNPNDEIALVEGKDAQGQKVNYVQVGSAIEPVGDRDLLHEATYAQAIKNKDWKALNDVYSNEKIARGDKENIEIMVRAQVLQNPDQEIAFFDWHEGKDADGKPAIMYRDTPRTTTLKNLYTLLGEEKATAVLLGYFAQDVQTYTPEQMTDMIVRATNVEELKQKGIRGTPLTEAQEASVNKGYEMFLDTDKSDIEVVRTK